MLAPNHLTHVIGAGPPTGETLEDVRQSEILNATVVALSPQKKFPKLSGPVTAADAERLRLEFLNAVEGDEHPLMSLGTWRFSESRNEFLYQREVSLDMKPHSVLKCLDFCERLFLDSLIDAGLVLGLHRYRHDSLDSRDKQKV